MEKSLRQTGFVKNWKERVESERPELADLSDEDLLYLLNSHYEELSELMKLGYRVIFEGHLSYYTKPIKRKCTNMHTGEEWWSYKRRIRTKPMDLMKSRTEIDLTEEEYLELQKGQKKGISV